MGTHEEDRKAYRQVMGRQLGNVYHLLWQHCAILHMRWEQFEEMFAEGQEEFDIMNEVAPGFFREVQDRSWEGILLYLCRFADPAKVSGKSTVSLEALTKIAEAQKVPNLLRLVTQARAHMKFAQDWRNRLIAHADLEHELEKSAKPLATASRAHVRKALSGIVDVLKAVEHHFTGNDLGFGGTGLDWGGTRVLLDLKLATRLRKERWSRIESGEPTAGDMDWEKWK